MKQKADLCVNEFNDNSTANCEFNPDLVVGHVLSLDLKKKLEIGLLGKASMIADLAARALYLVKGYIDAPENEVSGLETAKLGYGGTVVTGNSTDINITYNLPYSQCQFRALQSWSNVKVLAWPIDKNANIGGTLVEEDDKLYSRGQISKFIIPKSLPFKFNKSDVVVSPFTWLADSLQINTWDKMNVDLAELDGVITIAAVVTEPTDTGFKLRIEAGCNGTGISGLENDLVVLDSNNDPVSVTVVDDGDGNYTITGVFAVGTYLVNLASDVVSVGDALYSSLSTGATIEVTA